MLSVLTRVLRPALVRSNGVGLAPKFDPVEAAGRFQQLKATSTAITDFYKKQQQGTVEEPVRAEVTKDILALSSSKDLTSPEAAKVKEILNKMKEGKPLTGEDVAELKKVVEHLSSKILGDEKAIIADSQTSIQDLGQLAWEGATPEVQKAALDALVARAKASQDPKELAELAKPIEHKGGIRLLGPVREAVAANPKASPEVLHQLITGNTDSQIQKLVVQNPSTSLQDLKNLAAEGLNEEVKKAAMDALAARAKASQDPKELAELAKPIDHKGGILLLGPVREAVAANPKAPPEVLRQLITGNTDSQVQKLVAQNPSTSLQDLMQLAEGGLNKDVKEAAAKVLQSRGPELLERFTKLDVTKASDSAEMRKLASVADPETRAKMITQLVSLGTKEAQACLHDIIKDARGPAGSPPSLDFKITIAHLDLDKLYGKLSGDPLKEVKGWIEEGQKVMNVDMARNTDTALTKLQAADKSKPPRLTDDDRKVLVSSVAVGSVISQVAAEEAFKKMASMPKEDYEKLRKLLDKAGNDTEKAFILKALAAGRSMADIEKFAGQIHTMTQTEMIKKCTLADTDSDAVDEGIRQQHHHSCGPTTVEAMEGEVDPIYALGVREANTNIQAADPLGGNKALAADQKAKLESGGAGVAGVAKPRSGTAVGGSGRWCADLMNKLEKKTHCHYATSYITGGGPPTLTAAQAINKMEEALKKGMPVPLVIGQNGTDYAHYVLAANVRGAAPNREFQVHDPWDGVTRWVKESEMDPGPLNPPIAGHTTLSALEVPTRK